MKFGLLYFCMFALAAAGIYAAARDLIDLPLFACTEITLPMITAPGASAGTDMSARREAVRPEGRITRPAGRAAEPDERAAAIAPAGGAAPVYRERIRLRVFSLEKISELSVESRRAAGTRGLNAEPDPLRAWDDTGVSIYSAERIRLTARGDQLLLDGDEIASPLSLHPAAGPAWVAPLSAPPRAHPRLCVSTRAASVQLRAARASRVFAAYSLQIYARAGELIVIAARSLEDYIAGVLAAEAGPYASLPYAQAEQYLAAQTVACRSYAVYYLQGAERRHRDKNFDYDFCDTTDCQAWRDQAVPYPEIVLHAARATRGMVLGINTSASVRYVPGFYSSTAAASTVLPSEVWGGTEMDGFFTPVTNRLPGEPELLNKRSPFARWEWRENKETFRTFMRTAFKIAWDGERPKIEYSARGVARRIRFGAGGQSVILGYRFRDEYCRSRGWGTLCSLHFSVRLEDRFVVFSGSGLGHGVGLCQYGAMELARRSWAWGRILRFYYPKLSCVAYPP